MILRYEARVVPIAAGSAVIATARPDPHEYDARPGAELTGTLSTLRSDAVLLGLIDRLRIEAGRPTLAPREADELRQLRRSVAQGLDARRRAVLTDRNPESEPPSEWLTVRTVADRLGVSRERVRHLLTPSGGRLRGEHNGPGGTWRIDPRSVEDYEAERSKNP